MKKKLANTERLLQQERRLAYNTTRQLHKTIAKMRTVGPPPDTIIFIFEREEQARGKVKELKAKGIHATILRDRKRKGARAKLPARKIEALINQSIREGLRKKRKKRKNTDNKRERLQK